MAKIENKVKGLRTIPVQEFLALEFNQLKDSKRNVTKLVNAIKKNGWSFPVFVWNNFVIDGTGRKLALEALVKEGFEIEEIPVVDIEAKNLKEAKQKALEVSSQYGDITKDSFLFFAEDLELDFETFNIGGIDKDILITPDEKDDEVPEVPEKPKSKLGDLYELGEHRVLCGDSTKLEDVERLMDGLTPDFVLADPPYGIDVVQNKSVGGAAPTKFGTADSSNIVEASTYSEIIGDETTETAQDFYNTCVSLGYKNIALWGGNYFTDFLAPSRCWIVWDKEMTGNFSEAEMAWTSFTKGGVKVFKHLWNGLSREGNRKDELSKRVHPTQKPVGLFVEILKRFDGFKSIYDGFLGSGSTLIAAEKTGRICYGVELDEKYCDVIVQRYVDYVEEPVVKLNGKIVSWQKSK